MGFFYNGGGERTVLNEAIELQKRGYKVTVFSPIISLNCFPELLNQTEFFETLKFPLNIPFKNALKMILSCLIIHYHRYSKFDVIIAHSQPSNWIASQIKRRLKIPYISYLHQVNRFYAPRKIDLESGWSTNRDILLLGLMHRNNNLLKKLDKYSIKNSNLILTNSKWIKTQIENYYDLNSIICYPGVDIKKFKPKKNFDPCQNPYLLSTNRHYPQKRLDYLINIIKMIKKTHPDIRCQITGEYTHHTKYLMELTNKIGVQENIIFTGNLDTKELLDSYQKAYAYVYTSPEEDFGLGPLEAGACGIPSITWNYAGPKETVIDKVTGIRIEPYKVEKMAASLLKLLDDPELRTKIGLNARKHVQKNFSWKSHVNILEKCIDSVSK